MKTRYDFIIGSNNETKVVEIRKIKGVMNKRFKGYSIINMLGFWEGTEEKSVIVRVDLEKPLAKGKIKGLIAELKKVLRQDAIGLERSNASVNYL